MKHITTTSVLCLSPFPPSTPLTLMLPIHPRVCIRQVLRVREATTPSTNFTTCRA